MKRKLLICSSLITLLLSVFSVPIFAEETVQDSSNLHTLSDGVLLDQYFYDNYDLMPYLQSTNNQYIDTGIKGSSELITSITFSDVINNGALFGIYPTPSYNTYVNLTDDYMRLVFSNSGYNYPFKSYDFNIATLVFDKNKVYYNNSLVNEFQYTEFTSNLSILIFARHADGSNTIWDRIKCKIYKFSIFDTTLNNGEGAYVRYYYPAKSKSSGTLGFYDAVTKTFFPSSYFVAFSDPTDDHVENFQISSFLTNSLIWIDQIFDAVIQMPIVIIFMAIGLAGAMFRWGRRIVHF